MPKERLFCTAGVHPTRCSELDVHPEGPEAYIAELMDVIKEGKDSGKLVAIGECGLGMRALFSPSQTITAAVLSWHLITVTHGYQFLMLVLIIVSTCTILVIIFLRTTAILITIMFTIISVVFVSSTTTNIIIVAATADVISIVAFIITCFFFPSKQSLSSSPPSHFSFS
jgi:hypothetical protein